MKTFKKYLIKSMKMKGNNYSPELIETDEMTIANYTGQEVKKNPKGNWAVFPKPNTTAYGIVARGRTNYGFNASQLVAIKILDVDYTKGIITAEFLGFEVPVKYILSDFSVNDKIAYFYIND